MSYGGRVVDPHILEAAADQVHAFAGHPDGLEHVHDIDLIVRRHGLGIEYDDGLPQGQPGIVLPGKIVLQRGMREPKRVATLAHEFTHALERRYRWDASHGDIWSGALMIAWPLSAIRAGLDPMLSLPAELIVYRAKMPAAARILRRQGRLDVFV